jgi:hypothetical protein
MSGARVRYQERRAEQKKKGARLADAFDELSG